MKLVQPRRQGQGSQIFSGKVKVSIQGVATNGLIMSKVSGQPAKSFTLSEVTVEEVYNLLHSVVEEIIESTQVQGIATNGLVMSGKEGMPSLSFTLSDVRVEEVNNMVEEVADKE